MFAKRIMFPLFVTLTIALVLNVVMLLRKKKPAEPTTHRVPGVMMVTHLPGRTSYSVCPFTKLFNCTELYAVTMENDVKVYRFGTPPPGGPPVTIDVTNFDLFRAHDGQLLTVTMDEKLQYILRVEGR